MFILRCFLFKQKTENEMRISDWSSDVCSSDLRMHGVDVQLLSYAPGTACFERQWCAAVHDSIDIGPANAGKAGVPVSSYALAVYHSHGQGTHFCVKRSEARRVGNECVRMCRSSRSPTQ